MKIVLFGATGLTGQQVLTLALQAGHDVTATARNPSDLALKHERLRVVKADGQDAASVAAAVAGHDAVVSALGSRTRAKNTVRSDSARNLIAAMKPAGVKRLIWLSAAGVGDSADQARRSSFVFGRIIMPLMLKAVYADAAIADEALLASGLDVTVVRPVGLNNKPATGRVVVTPIPSSYIPRADVAKFMLDQLGSSEFVGKAPIISN